MLTLNNIHNSLTISLGGNWADDVKQPFYGEYFNELSKDYDMIQVKLIHNIYKENAQFNLKRPEHFLLGSGFSKKKVIYLKYK